MRVFLLCGFLCFIPGINSDAAWPGGGSHYAGGIFGPPPSYQGLGDIDNYAHYFGMRAYSAAIAAAGTQKMATLVRAGDGHACDILPALTGLPGLTANCSTPADNGQAYGVFIGGGNTYGVTLWDQVDLGQSVNATLPGPSVIFDCGVGHACIRFPGTGSYLQGTFSAMNLAQPYSLSVVGKRTGDFSSTHQWLSASLIAMGIEGDATAFVFAGTIPPHYPAADNSWHCLNAVLNGTDGLMNVDGTLYTTQSFGTSNYSDLIIVGITSTSGTMTGDIGEVAVASHLQSADTIATVCANQTAWWH